MNIYNDCPLDSRDFTDYRSSSDIHNELIIEYKLKNNHEFNNFIRNKGVDYFTNKKKEIEKLYGCGPYNNTMLEEKYTQVCDKNKCELKNNENNGIGTGRTMKFNDNNVSGNLIKNN